MADLIDKVTDIARKLRKSAKKCNDPVLQELITDLSLSVADLRVQLAEQRQVLTETADANEATGTHAATTPTPTPAPRSSHHATTSSRAETLSTGTTTTQLPDIGDLRKFPN
ncbi:MAG TPA: hypothetical protein VF384_04320 [Planctomycetota bacterium]